MPLKHKHMVIEQELIDRAKEYLGVTKDTEAVSEALRLIAEEAEINDVLRKSKGRAKIEKVFG